MIMKNSIINERLSSQRGFTLVELLVTVAILGILSAIAIPQYSGYQASVRDQEANVTMRRIVTAQEAYFLEHSSYISCDETSCSALLPEVGYIPSDIDLNFASTGNDCTATAMHQNGTGAVFSWTS